MITKLLIDECLTVALVAAAKERGMLAEHVAHLGKVGWQDWNVVPFALENDYVLVTNNRSDFLKRYAKLDLHNGLIIIIPSVAAAAQRQLFGRALDVVAEQRGELINQVIEVLVDGSVHIRAWANLDHDPDHVANPKWR